MLLNVKLVKARAVLVLLCYASSQSKGKANCMFSKKIINIKYEIIDYRSILNYNINTLS